MGVSIEQINGLQAIIDDLYNKLEKLNNNSSSNQTDDPNQEQNNNNTGNNNPEEQNNNQQQEETFVPNTNKYKMKDLYPDTYSIMTSVNLNNHPNILTNLTSTYQMFSGCIKLTSILNIDKLDTSHVTDMGGMFWNCCALADSTLKNIVSQLNTNSVTNMSSMFIHCDKLQSFDFSVINTENVINMYSMFSDCIALKTVDASKLNCKNLKKINGMFSGCKSLTNVTYIDTSKMDTMIKAFENCTSLPATFPWAIDCSSITKNAKEIFTNNGNTFTNFYGLYGIFNGSSVTKVTLKNVKSDIKSQFTAASLKENGSLTITFA